MPKNKKKNFPHISRFIHALQQSRVVFNRRNAPFLIVLGILFLVILNLFEARSLPQLVQQLLQNPSNTQALAVVLKNSGDPGINQQIRSVLNSQGDRSVALSVQTEKNQLYEKLTKLSALIKKNMLYPDGYAYRSVLYCQLHQPMQAVRDIQKARELDPNRAEFIVLEKQVNECQ